MSESTETRLLEMVGQSLKELGDIKSGLALQTQMLNSHTASDASNFEALRDGMARLQEKLETIELARAREEGEKAAESRSHKFSAATWGGGIAAFLTGLIEMVRHFWPSGQ